MTATTTTREPVQVP